MVRRERESYGITLAEAQPVFVQKTTKDGPADKAGIQAGDRIVKVCVHACLCVCVRREMLCRSPFLSLTHLFVLVYMCVHSCTCAHTCAHTLTHAHTHTNVQVNGTSIMNKSHLEVVDMIKKSSFVSLTVMRKISGEESRHSSEWRGSRTSWVSHCRHTYVATFLGFLSLKSSAKRL